MATKLDVYREVCALVGVPRFGSVSEDHELRYVLDDEYDGAVDYVLQSVPWRFAHDTVTRQPDQDSNDPVRPGYDNTFNMPGTSLRVLSIYVSDTQTDPGRRLPIDCRMDREHIYANHTGGLQIDFISTDGRTEANWPEPFTKALSAYLAFRANQRLTKLNGRTDDLFGLFQRTLVEATPRHAIAEDPWLEHQLSGAFLSSVRYILEQGAWEFALKDSTLSSSGTAFDGFDNAFPKPSDWVRTHALFKIDANDREVPVDAREHEESFSSDATGITVRYVSSDYWHTPLKWPEAFVRCVAAHLGIDYGDMGVTQDSEGNTQRPIVWPDYLQRALQQYALQPNPWLKAQLDGSYRAAVQRVLEGAFWNFALKSDKLATTTGAAEGYSQAYNLPSDHLVTHSVYAVTTSQAREVPIEFRELEGKIHAYQTTGLSIRYVTRDGATDYDAWPDEFLGLVGLEIGAGPLASAEAQSVAAYRAGVARRHTTPPSPWMPFQKTNQFREAAETCLSWAPWDFALLINSRSVANSSTPVGFSYAYDKFGGHLRTHAIYTLDSAGREIPIDIREFDDEIWSNEDQIWIRYVGKGIARQPETWPAEFLTLVGTYLGIGVPEGANPAEYVAARLEAARRIHAAAENEWLPYQRDGRFRAELQSTYESAFWRWGVVSAGLDTSATSPPAGFSSAFDLPADHLRTHSIYVADGANRQIPIDCREEGGGVYANTSDVDIRYLGTGGLSDYDAWPDAFMDLVLRRLRQEPLETRLPAEQAAVAAHAVAPSPWLQPQLTGLFRAAVERVVEGAFWRFGLATTSLVASSAGALDGFEQAWDLPADHLVTHSVFYAAPTSKERRETPVECREEDGQIHTHQTQNIQVRYTTTGALTSYAAWPDEFIALVGAEVGAGPLADAEPQTLSAYRTNAVRQHCIEPSPWLPHQLTTAFRDAAGTCLSWAAWRFAIATIQRSSATSTTPIGFTYAYDQPASSLRTHAIFFLDANGREIPVDCREEGDEVWANANTINIRYVDAALVRQPEQWPDEFLWLVGAYLGTNVGEGVNPAEIVAARLETARRKHALADNDWLPRQLDGAYRAAVQRIMTIAFWKFALRTVALTGTSAPINGFDYAYEIPADHLATHSLFYSASGRRETPLDFREEDGAVHTHQASGVHMRYTSRDGLTDYQGWPDEFLALVGSEIGAGPLAGGDGEALTQYRANAIRQHAVAPSPWLQAQMDGSFWRAAETMLFKAFWRFAQKQVEVTSGPSPTVPGYTYGFDIPDDHVRTRALYVRTNAQEHPADIREDGGVWSANVSPIVAHYTSRTLGMDVSLWPTDYLELIGAYLGIFPGTDPQPSRSGEEAWVGYLKQCKRKLAVDESPWLAHQFDGSFPAGVRSLLWEKDWHFATRTVTLNASTESGIGLYDYSFDKPSDWGATVRIYKLEHGEEEDLSYREEGDVIYADADPIHLRYIDKDQIEDPSNWPEYFDTALLAWLRYRHAMGDPEASGAEIENRKAAFNDSLRSARNRDDTRRERPRFNRDGGRFTQARFGGYYGYFRNPNSEDG